MTDTVDRMLRGFDPATYARIKRAAQARGITMAEYVTRLVKLHEAMLTSEAQRPILERHELGRVNV